MAKDLLKTLTDLRPEAAEAYTEVTGTPYTAGNGEEKRALDVAVKELIGSVSGSFTPQGLTIAGRISEVTIDNSSWTALPLLPLAERNSLSIQNRSGGDIRIQFDNTAGATTGIVIPDGFERFYQITPDIVLYARSVTAPSLTLTIEELS